MVSLNVEIFRILREEIYGPETNQNNYCFELEIFSGFSLGAYIFFLSYDVFIIMISIFPWINNVTKKLEFSKVCILCSTLLSWLQQGSVFRTSFYDIDLL